VRGAVLAGCRALRVIGRLGVGLDNIDLEACRRRGIRVCPAAGANAVSVAEYVIAALLTVWRNVWAAGPRVLAGEWPRNDFMLREAAGKTLGLIGFGEIARAVAKRALALDMQILAYDPLVGDSDPAWTALATRKVDLGELLRTADAVSLHVPLLRETRLLIDAARLGLMKRDAVLINTARGGLIEEQALADALVAGRLGAAVLDVFEREPLPPDSIFRGVPRLWLTPHVAGVTLEANRRVSAVTVANVRNALLALR
jgi:(S)-sulfolactate dehydrogenase